MEKNPFDQFDEPEEIGAPEPREPIPSPFELSDDPDISEAQMRKRFDDRDVAERERVQSSYGLFGSSWGLLDDEGSKTWAAGEQTSAQDSIEFWSKTRDYLRARRERIGEAAKRATGTFTMLPGLPGIKVPTPEGASHGFQDWAERKADENIEHAKLRKALAEEMLAGKREGAKTKAWLAMGRSLAKGVSQDVLANLLKGVGAGLSYAQEAVDGKSYEASEDSEIYKLGQWIEQAVEDAIPDDEARQHEWKTKLARGAGSMAGFYGPSLVLQYAMKIGAKGMMAVTAGMGSGAQSGAMFEEASRAMAERPDEVSKDDRFKAWLAGIGTGATEAFPLGHWLSGPGSGVTRSMLAEAFEEGGQEFAQSVLENLAASALYDPDRKWDDNAWEGMAIGGALGAKMSLLQSAWKKAAEQREARLRRGPGGQPSRPDVEPTPVGPEGGAGGRARMPEDETVEPEGRLPMAAFAPRGPSRRKGIEDEDITDYLRANNDLIVDEQGREFDAVKRPVEARRAVERQLKALDRYADERDLKWYMDNGDVVLEDLEGRQYRPDSNVNSDTFVETLGREGPEALDSVLAGQGFTGQVVSQTDKELFGDFDALVGDVGRAGKTPVSHTERDAKADRVATEVATESDQTLAGPAAAQPTRKINDEIRAQFGELLAGTRPRKEWAAALGVSPAEMAELEAEALKDGRLRKAANGQIRRAPKAKAAAPRPAAAPAADSRATPPDLTKLSPGAVVTVRTGKGKATDRWQIGRAIKLKDGGIVYSAKRWIKKGNKWSGTAYQIAAERIISVEPEAVVGVGSPEDMAAREAAARAFMRTPEWIGASLTGGVVTNNVSDYMTDGWKARREYVDPNTGEGILGFDAAVDLFIEQKKAEVAGGVAAERKAYIVMGLPGSGKGTVSTVLRDRAQAVHITCDDCKLMIPEYQGGFNAMGVHEESSDMAAEATDRLLTEGSNVILEKVGSSDASIAKAARQFREEGYTVSMIYVDVPRAVAMERAIKRYRRTGRIVPLAYYDQLNIAEVYTILKKEAAADETAKIDWIEPTGWRVVEASSDDLRLDIPDRGASPAQPQRPALGGSGGAERAGSDVRAPQAASAGPAPGSAESRVARHVREIEETTGRTIDPGVVDYATRLLAALPDRVRFDAVFEELSADKTMTVQRARDLATLVGAEAVNKRSTKAKSLDSIKQRRVNYEHFQGEQDGNDTAVVGEAAGDVSARRAPEDVQGVGEIGLPEGAPGAGGAGGLRSGGDTGLADDERTGSAPGLYRAGEASGGDPLAGARDRRAAGDILAAELSQSLDEDRIAEREAREARTRRNYEITDADEIGQGGAKAKVRGNIAALKVLKEIEEAGREATEDEKKVLVKYVGWGAFAQDVFRTHKAEWAHERAQLADLLTPEEMRSARESTINAHYTSPEVIRAMWGAVHRLGFRGGRAIEPAVGVGHFIGLTPRDVRADTAWTAVDLDTLSARITKALYGAADVRAAGYETQQWPDGFFDLAISNVPFGNFKIHDKRYPSLSIHDYFFAKSLDKVRPGGLVAFITSHYTLDKSSAVARREMAKRATFLGAIRLPGGNKGAFASNAGADVTTDIIFLRKRVDGEPLGDQSWLETAEINTPEGKTKINRYFADHPEMMLGKMRLTGTMYGGQEPVLIGPTDKLDQRILEAAEALPEGAMLPRGVTSEDIGPKVDTSGAAARVKEGAFYEEGGKLYRRIEGVGQPVKGKPKDLEKIRDFMGLRDIVNEMLARQAVGDLARMDALRAGLNESYDAFVAKHGLINQTIVSTVKRSDGTAVTTRRRPVMSLVRDDPDAYKVSAIEVYNETSGTARKAAIFVADIVGAYERPAITGPADALAVSLNERGKVDPAFIAERLGMTEAQAIRELGNRIYLDPNGDVWRTAEQYLAGDVVTKLDAARAAAEADPKYKRNVKALEAVQPEPLTRVDITVPMGAPWVPGDVYQDFVHDTMNARVEIGLNEATKKWQLLGSRSYFPPSAVAQWATRDVRIERILEAALNQTYITVSHKMADGSSVRDVAAEQEANARVRALRDAFTGSTEAGIEGWVWKDESRAQRLEAIYNQGFNRLVPETHDGSHLSFPGLARTVTFPDGSTGTIDLLPHRTSAVWRIIQNGNTLLNHVVGAGKTWTMIMSGMEQKRLGLIQRPMYVVPNHMLEQFSTEFLQAYPGAKLLVASKDHMSLARRREFAARVAAEKWDGIIITHDAFGRLRMSDQAYADFYKAQVEELEEIKQRQSKERGKEASVKEIEKAKKRLVTKIKKLSNIERKDAGVTFEELGVDFLYVDEAHLFKNLSFPTQHARVKGISNASESQRATDLFIKIRHLERSRPGRSAVFATGTPVSNTMAELFTMQRYLQLDTLQEYGIAEFDAWAHTFGQVVAQTELAPDGRTFRTTEAFSRFVNIPELVAIWSRVADTKTADMLNLPRPKLKGGAITVVESEPSEAEEAYMGDLIARAERLRKEKVDPEEDNMLKIVSEGRKVATDMRLIDPAAEPNPDGKIAKAVENIHRIWEEGSAAGADAPNRVQMVFLDMGVPGSKGRTIAAPASADDLVMDRVQEIRKQLAVEAGEAVEEDAEPDLETSELTAGLFNLYEELRSQLVARGIPKEEIAFIHEAKGDDGKARLFAAVKEGRVRVLIGSTSKMGVGTNVQKRLIAMHHIDAPWKPAEVEQRDGRIIRQGNLNKEVEMYRYVTRRSFDAYMWQTLERKARFIGQLQSGAKGIRTAEDIDNPLPEAAQLKAAASGDMRIVEHAELTREINDLEVARRAHVRAAVQAGAQLTVAEETVKRTRSVLDNYAADAARVTDLSGDNFTVTLSVTSREATVTERKKAGEAIRAYLWNLGQSAWWGTARNYDLGTISGFAMSADVKRTDEGIEVLPKIAGAAEYASATPFILTEGSDPVGMMSRFERLVREAPRLKEAAELALAKAEADIPRLAKAAQGSPFPRQARLDEAKARLIQIEKELSGTAPKPSPAADAIREFVKDVAALKKETGVKTVPRKPGPGNDGPLMAAISMALVEQVEAIKTGSRMAVLEQATGSFLAQAEQTLAAITKMRAIDPDVATIPELETLADALNDLSQIITDRLQAGYDLMETMDAISATLQGRLTDIADAFIEINDEVSDMFADLSDLTEEIQARLPEIDDDTGEIGDTTDAINTQARELVPEQFWPEHYSALDIMSEESSLTQATLTQIRADFARVTGMDLDSLSEAELWAVQDQVNDLAEELYKVRMAAEWLSEMGYKKSEEADSVIDAIKEERIVPRVDELETAAEEVSDLIDVVDEALNGPTPESIIGPAEGGIVQGAAAATTLSPSRLTLPELRTNAVSIERLDANDPHPSVPVLAYHGTRATFSEQFDVDRARSLGIHFGTRAQADWFTGVRMGAPKDSAEPVQPALPYSRVFPVLLRLDNVLDVPDYGSWEPVTLSSELERTYPDRLAGLRAEVDRARASVPETAMSWAPAYSAATNRALRQGLTKRGIDALRYRNTVEGEGWSYIVWEKGKVSSAIDPDTVMLAADVAKRVADRPFSPPSARFVNEAPALLEEVEAEFRRILPQNIRAVFTDRLSADMRGMTDAARRAVVVSTLKGAAMAREVGRHETVHIFRELGLWTDAEWATLVARARKVRAGQQIRIQKADGTAFPGIQWYREEYYRPQVEAYAARRGLSRAEVEAELDELMNQELVAHMAETYVSGSARYGKTIDALLDRLLQALAAIARVLNRHGFNVLSDLVERQDAEAALDAAFSGQMADRPQQRRQRGGAAGLASALVEQGAGTAQGGRPDAGRDAQGAHRQVGGDRLARARAMGFDTSRVWYHGTTESFDRFDPGLGLVGERASFFASSGEEASGWANYNAPDEAWEFLETDAKYASGARVIPVYVRGDYKTVDMKGVEARTEHLRPVLEQARSDGFAGVIFENMKELSGHSQTQLAVFDPTNIRSVNARFEDEDTDILLGAIGMAEPTMPRERDVRAAIEYNGRIFTGATHIDAMLAAASAQERFVTIDMVAERSRDGFLVDGVFLTRDQAADVILRAAGLATLDTKIENGLRRLAGKVGAPRPPAMRAGVPEPGPVPALAAIIEDLKASIGMTATQGRYGLTVFDRTVGPEQNRPPRSWHFRPQEAVRGQYDNLAGVARYRLASDIDTIAHEGGHHVDRLLGPNLQRLKEQFRPELETFAFINMTEPAPDREPPVLPPPGNDPMRPVYSGVDLDADAQRVLAEVATREEIRQSQVAAGADPSVVGELSAFDRAARDELEHRVGLRMAEALIRDVVRGSTPETRAAFVRARFSANGAPRPGGRTSQALHEGFAEFFREYVLNPDRARSFSPGFFQAFEDLVDATDPALLQNLERVQLIATSKEYDAYLKATTLDRGMADLVSNADQSIVARTSRTLEAIGQRGTISGFAAKVYTSMIDEAHPFYLATKALLERADLRQAQSADPNAVRPVSLAVHENPYKLIRSIGDSFKTGLRWIQDGVPNYRDATGPRSPSLWGALTKVMGTRWDLDKYQKFGVYLESRRAIEEWKAWDKKLADTKALTGRINMAQRQTRILREELAKARGKAERRERAVTANRALIRDYDRELQSLLTREAGEVRDLQEGQVATPGMSPQRVRNAHARLADIRSRITAFEERRATVAQRLATVETELADAHERVTVINAGIARREAIVSQSRSELARLREKGLKRPPHRVRPEEHAERIKAIEAEIPEVKEAAPLVYDFVWQMAVHDHQAGRITDAELAYRESRKHFYVPFARDMRDLVPDRRGFGGRAMGRRFAKDKMFAGSDRAVVNPLETIIDQTFHRAAATHFNDTMKALANLADFAGSAGGGEIVERVVRTEEIEANDAGWRTLEGDLIGLGYDPDDAREMVKRVESDFGDTQLLLQWSPEHTGAVRPLLLPLWEGGERKFLRVNDPDFANHIHTSVNGMGRELSNLLLDWLSKPATWLRIGVTTNPTFIIPNVIRDMWSAWILTGSFMDPRTWPVITQARGIYHELAQTDMARLYQEVAGIMGGQNVAALSRVRDKMDVLALQERGLHIKPLRLTVASTLGAAAGFAVGGPAGSMFGAILGAGLHRAGKGGLHFTETLAQFSDMSETATRLGVFTEAYRAALAYNPALTPYQAAQEAAYVARDLIDFGRRGSRMLAAARLVPFLNANIQGLDKAIRTLTARSDRGRVIGGAQLAGTTALGAALGGAAAGPVGAAVGATAAPAVATMLAARSDAVRRLLTPVHKRVQGLQLSAEEERTLGASAKAWANLACYSLILLAFRALYWDDDEYNAIEARVKYRSQPVKLGDQWFGVPKAFEWAIPANLIEAGIDAQYFNDPRFLERVQGSLYDNLMPPLMPQTAKLWRDIGANRSSLTQRPIVPDWMRSLPPQEQFNAYSSELALMISRTVNETPILRSAVETAGSAVFATDFELSPLVIDYAISTGFGYWGKDIQKSMNVTRDAGPASGRAIDFPILGTILQRISIDPNKANEAMAAFYEQMSPFTQGFPRASAGYDAILKNRGQVEANQFLATLDEDHRAYALLMGSSSTLDRRLHPLNRLEDVVGAIKSVERDVIMERLDDTEVPSDPRRIALAPQKAAEIRDILAQIKAIEAHNTMVYMGYRQFAMREMQDVTPAYALLQASSPEAARELEQRMGRRKVQPFDDVRTEWPLIKQRLLEDWAVAVETGEAMPTPKRRKPPK